MFAGLVWPTFVANGTHNISTCTPVQLHFCIYLWFDWRARIHVSLFREENSFRIVIGRDPPAWSSHAIDQLLFLAHAVTGGAGHSCLLQDSLVNFVIRVDQFLPLLGQDDIDHSSG